MSFRSFFSPLLLLVLIAVSYSDEIHQHTCIHDTLDIKPELIEVPYETNLEGRILATYSNIRILFDYSSLTGVTSLFTDYIKNDIIAVAKNYFEATLSVKPVSGNLKAQGQTTVCGIKTPSTYLNTGVAADLVIFVLAENNPSSSYIAMAGACLLDTTTYRPVFGKITFNSYYVQVSSNNAKISSHVQTTLHEITHVLGFSSSLYTYYINPTTGKRLTGHVKTKMINKQNQTILAVEPLITEWRKHFNCPTSEGAYIENQGGAASAGSHLERRVLYNDYMTASSIDNSRITNISLALLQGTGWYQVDFNMAEPFTYGQGKGCTFLEGTCLDPKTLKPKFSEFCTPGQSDCGWTGNGLGSCGISGTNPNLPDAFDYWGNNSVVGDSFADNCPTINVYSNLNCNDESNQAGALLKTNEFYGYGAKCFRGTLYPGTGSLLNPYGYCFKAKCVLQTSGKYIVQVTVGGTVVNCASATNVTVTGFGGRLFCPDPAVFCNQDINEGWCRRKCSGRGTCVNKVCQCTPGWGSDDCSRRVYTDKCTKCVGQASKKTSCYGDVCACNPATTTCPVTS